MKNNNTNIILAFGLLGFGFYYISQNQSNNNNSNSTYQNYPTIPPAPPQNTPAWQSWVLAILASVEPVLDLWQPGGPFYNPGTGDIYDFVDPTDFGYDYSDFV